MYLAAIALLVRILVLIALKFVVDNFGKGLRESGKFSLDWERVNYGGGKLVILTAAITVPFDAVQAMQFRVQDDLNLSLMYNDVLAAMLNVGA